MFDCGWQGWKWIANLKKLANFFKFFLCIAEKALKTNYNLFFL